MFEHPLSERLCGLGLVLAVLGLIGFTLAPVLCVGLAILMPIWGEPLTTVGLTLAIFVPLAVIALGLLVVGLSLLLTPLMRCGQWCGTRLHHVLRADVFFQLALLTWGLVLAHTVRSLFPMSTFVVLCPLIALPLSSLAFVVVVVPPLGVWRVARPHRRSS